MNRHFAPGAEFSLIEALFEEGHFAADGSGLGDDAYLLRAGGETWAVSTDASVEGIHYRLDWTSPEEALAKCLLSNLSDINAMGGRASLALFNLGASSGWDEAMMRRLGSSLQTLEAAHGFRVVGGDTVRKGGESFFAFTVLGRVVGKPLLRSGARPGQGIYLSGRLGGSAAGLALLTAGVRLGDARFDPYLRAHLRPSPPLALGPLISSSPAAGAAIDISDGLSSELWHLSRQSGCRLVVEWGKLPYERGLDALPGGAGWRDWVLHGGEEYQLLFTGQFSGADLEAMARQAEIREIGRVVEGQGVGIVDEGGTEKELAAAGWSH